MEASTFFSRLLRQPKVAAQVVEPDDIGEFDKAWRTVKNTLEHPDERQLVKGIQSTEVPRCLTHIVDALVHEANTIDEDTLGSCMEYFVNHDLLTNLERLSESDRPHGIKSEVLRATNNLIVLLSDRFLVHNAVHRPLRRLLRSCIGDEPEDRVRIHGSAKALGAAGSDLDHLKRSGGGEELEGDLVDLMCILCSRMRAYPPLLLIFFHDKAWTMANSNTDPTPDIRSTTMSPTPTTRSRSTRHSTSNPNAHFEFLLFSYLLRFVHREGRIGDFARAGLLFLFDIAFLPDDEAHYPSGSSSNVQQDPLYDARISLATFILDGDFADVMAAGLGAIWSLLPSKLKVPTLGEIAQEENESGGMILGAGPQDGQEGDDDDVVRLSTDGDVRDQLEMLLKLFGFLQDILTRCSSGSPADATSETMSLSSSSESTMNDPSPKVQSRSEMLGRSLTEAALQSMQASFLDSVLYPSILECSSKDGSAVAIMTYLDVLFSNIDDGPLLDRILTYLLNIGDDSRESRFTLKDLIIDNIRSEDAQASAAALRLLRTLSVEHCARMADGMLTTLVDIHRPSRGAPVTERSETELHSSLIEKLDPNQVHLDQSTGYNSYLADMHASIQNDRCFNRFHAFDGMDPQGPGRRGRDKVRPNDPLLRTLLFALGRLLSRTPNENVALTGALVSLASCPNRSIAGWLLYDEQESDPWARHRQSSSGSDSDSDVESDDKAHLPSKTHAKPDPPAMYQILSHLTSQISTFRARIPEFDHLLSERRQGLLYTDGLDEAMNVMLEMDIPASSSIFGTPTTPTQSPMPASKKKVGMMGTLASFLTPGRKTPASSPGPVTPQRSSTIPNTDMTASTGREGPGPSPFKAHYDTLVGQEVEAAPSPVRSGVWSPATRMGPAGLAGGNVALEVEYRPASSLDTAHAISDEDHEDEVKEGGRRRVSLSTALDNCIILEEFCKELVGVISARRALGVDEVSFL